MVSPNSIIITTVIVFGVFDNYTYAYINYDPDICMDKFAPDDTDENTSRELDFNCLHYRGMSMKPNTNQSYELVFEGYIQSSLNKTECALKFRQWCLLFAGHAFQSCFSELTQLGYTGEDIEQDHIIAKTLTLPTQQHLPKPTGKLPNPPKLLKVKIPAGPKIPHAPKLNFQMGSFSHRYSFYLVGFTSSTDMLGAPPGASPRASPGGPTEAPSEIPGVPTNKMNPLEFCLETCIMEVRRAGFDSGTAKKNFDILKKQFAQEIPSNSNGKSPSQGITGFVKRKLPPYNFVVYGYADSYAMYLLTHYHFINDGINGLLDGIRWCNEKLKSEINTEEENPPPYQNMGNPSPYQNMRNPPPYQNMKNEPPNQHMRTPSSYQNMGNPSPYQNMGNPFPNKNMGNSPAYNPLYPPSPSNQTGGMPPSNRTSYVDNLNPPSHRTEYIDNYQNHGMPPSQH